MAKPLKYPLLDAMHLEYAVLYALESGCATAKQVRALLNSGPVFGRVTVNAKPQATVKATQITGALQRLRRAGVVANDAHDWKRVGGAR